MKKLTTKKKNAVHLRKAHCKELSLCGLAIAKLSRTSATDKMTCGNCERILNAQKAKEAPEQGVVEYFMRNDKKVYLPKEVYDDILLNFQENNKKWEVQQKEILAKSKALASFEDDRISWGEATLKNKKEIQELQDLRENDRKEFNNLAKENEKLEKLASLNEIAFNENLVLIKDLQEANSERDQNILLRDQRIKDLKRVNEDHEELQRTYRKTLLERTSVINGLQHMNILIAKGLDNEV